MYRVFLSYNSPDEMAVIWRLQTLAAASGLQLDVPSTQQRYDWQTISRMIDSADSVIVFLTDKATPQVRQELSYALTKNIPVIPIVESGAVTAGVTTILKNKHVPVFTLEPGNPWRMENELATYLKQEKVGKDSSNAILALAGTFIGLFLLDKLADT